MSGSTGRIWGCAGHRPPRAGGYSDRAFSTLVRVCEVFIGEQEPSKMYIGMGLGWEQAMATACLNKKIPYVACIPCKEQDKIWLPANKAVYQNLVSKAASVHLTFNGTFEENAACMHERNDYIAQEVDAVAVFWDEQPEGQTWEFLLFCYSRGKEVFNYYESWLIL